MKSQISGFVWKDTIRFLEDKCRNASSVNKQPEGERCEAARTSTPRP